MNNSKCIDGHVSVSAVTSYVATQSDPKSNRYVFSYTITIENNSDTPCQLVSRHWVIQDANNKIEEVYGEGVVGQQPLIEPGHQFQYSSGAVLETEIGTMTGRYFMLNKNRDEDSLTKKFEVAIPQFTLSVPRTIH